MKKITDKKELGGRLEVFEDFKKHFFMAKPHGFVNPPLVKTDLERAENFSKLVNADWTYVTDTSEVKMVNPFNLRYLKEVKKLPRLREIVVFVPNPLNRFLLKLVSSVIQPDRIFKRRKDFVNYVNRLA